MTTLVSNAEFARLPSDEQIATAVAALTARGMAAEVVASGAEARSRVLDLLPEGAEVFMSISHPSLQPASLLRGSAYLSGQAC